MNNQSILATNAILNRKSVRDFENKPIENEKLDFLFDSIIKAPTTENMSMFSVISVSNEETRSLLSRQKAIKTAPLVLVFCADYRRWTKLFSNQSETGRLPQEGEYQLALIDAVIAAQNCVIACEAVGLGSVYLGDIMEHYEDRSAALKLPLGVIPVLTLCIGYPTEKQLERTPTKHYSKELIIHNECYNDFTRDELLEMLRQRNSHDELSKTSEWLQKFAKRCVDGAGALERTRSIKAAISSLQDIKF